MNTEVNFNWKRLTNRCTHPIQPWKGNLPPAPEVPHAPVEYFRQLLDDTILDNAVYQTNFYSIQKNASRLINVDKNEIEQFFGCVIYVYLWTSIIEDVLEIHDSCSCGSRNNEP
jgi:hypothetical protein